jgi:hypothetical protein
MTAYREAGELTNTVVNETALSMALLSNQSVIHRSMDETVAELKALPPSATQSATSVSEDVETAFGDPWKSASAEGGNVGDPWKSASTEGGKEAGQLELGLAKQEVKAGSEVIEKEMANELVKRTEKLGLSEGAKLVGEKVLKYVPMVGIAVGVGLVTNDLIKGDYEAAVWDALEAIPVVGDVVGGVHLVVTIGPAVVDYAGEKTEDMLGTAYNGILQTQGIGGF